MKDIYPTLGSCGKDLNIDAYCDSMVFEKKKKVKKKQKNTNFHIIENDSCDLCHSINRTLCGFKIAKDEMTIAICKTCLILALHDLNGRDTI